MSKTSSELLDDVAAKVTNLLQGHLDHSLADRLGQRVADMLAEDWGGINVYVPKRLERRLILRNARIYRAYTGENIMELAREYSMSEQHLYAIIREEREKRGTKQGRLPL